MEQMGLVKERAVESMTSRLLVGLLVANLVLMSVVLFAGAAAVADVNAKYDVFATVMRHPELAGPFIATAVGSAAESFILGAVNGSIPNFLQNLLTTDFRGISTQLYAMATAVENTFDLNLQPAACYQPITCPQQQEYIMCPNGQQMWCWQQGEVVNCANQTCLSGSIVYGASLTRSVAAILRNYEGPVNAGATDPALSSGLFNLAAVFGWVESQTNINQWVAAGTTCKQVTSALNHLAWTGNYLGPDGNTHTFNVGPNVNQVLGYVNQVCNNLQNLGSARKKIHKKH